MVVALASPAQGQSLGFGLGLDNTKKTASSGGAPFVLATGLYSFRRLLPAFVGSPIRLRRASDNLQQDIGFSGDNFDLAAATTFCSATSCFVVTWYDQAPAAQNFTQVSAANQPPFLFACLNGIPCVSLSTTLSSMAAPSVGQTGVVTLNIVVNRTLGTGICVVPQVSNNSIKTRSGVAGLILAGSIGSITTSSAEAAWHSATGVINAAGSSFAVDGVKTAGSLTGSTTTAAPSMAAASTTTCLVAEMAFWQAYAMTDAEVTALNADQHAYWGF